MVIADEIAAKESVKVQQQLPHIQSVNSVSKNSTASSSLSVDSVNTKGHIARACRKNEVNAVCAEGELTEEPLFEEDELFMVYDVNAISRAEISVPLKIENNDCNMQLDTGCALSLAPMSFFKRVYPDYQ